MEIVNVSTEELYRYIPMQGLDSVEQALNAFAEGRTRSSRDTERHQVDAVGQSQGGFAQAFYMFAAPHMKGANNSFVQEQIMSEARTALQERDKWSRHFDYDGMGPFFKTSVEIDVFDRQADLYGLCIYAAYVGDKPEEGLSDFLSVPRTLVWASVEIETKPIEDDRFEFDFEQLARRLAKTLGHKVKGKDIANAMLSVDRYGENRSSFQLYGNDDCVAVISPGAVGGRFDYSQRVDREPPIDTWSVEGSVLRGRLRDSYQEEGKKAAPTLMVYVQSAHKDQFNSGLPIWDPAKKTEVLELRDKIAAALRPVV